MSTTCIYCGGEIIFRYIDGERVPIHLSGGCRGGGDYSERYGTTSSNRWFSSHYDPDDFCRPTTCTYCGAKIFFIRHNGGCVWLDALGWPWPKHPCYYEKDDQISHHLRNVAKSGEKATLAYILEFKERPNSFADQMVVISEDSRMGYVYTSGLKDPGTLPGHIVALNMTTDRMLIPSRTPNQWKVDLIDFGDDEAIKHPQLPAFIPGKVQYARTACPECGKEMNGSHLYHHRFTEHHVAPCPMCYTLVSPAERDDHLRTHHFTTSQHFMRCSVCRKRVEIESFHEHLLSAHKKRLCPVCHRFMSLDDFDTHMSTEHGLCDIHSDHQNEPRSKRKKKSGGSRKSNNSSR